MVNVNIEAQVKHIIADKLGVAEANIKLESHFIRDLGADSLDTVELIMELEREFNLSIVDEEAEKIQTVADTIQYIQKKISAR